MSRNEFLETTVGQIRPYGADYRQEFVTSVTRTSDSFALETIDRDQSVVNRHLNHLVDLGVAKKTSRVLPEGGRVNVYSPHSEEKVRRQLELGLYAWCLDAIELLEEVNEEKIAMMAESADTDKSGLGRSMVDRLLARGDSS